MYFTILVKSKCKSGYRAKRFPAGPFPWWYVVEGAEEEGAKGSRTRYDEVDSTVLQGVDVAGDRDTKSSMVPENVIVPIPNRRHPRVNQSRPRYLSHDLHFIETTQTQNTRLASCHVQATSENNTSPLRLMLRNERI